MNFLAHAYLSGDDPKLLVGNFAGDFIKGTEALERYDERIADGVRLHRAIDEYTDQHDVVRTSKDRLRSKYRHYAGVIVDMFYDHFLAVHWRDYHKLPLDQAAASYYRTMRSHRSILPERFNVVLTWMIRGNWLVQYRKIDGIRKALTGMASRTSFQSRLEFAADDLEKYYEDFRGEFLQFFPDLTAFVRPWQ